MNFWLRVTDGYQAYDLMYVDQPVMANARCKRFLGSYVTDSVICGDGEGNVGACGVRRSSVFLRLIICGTDAISMTNRVISKLTFRPISERRGRSLVRVRRQRSVHADRHLLVRLGPGLHLGLPQRLHQGDGVRRVDRESNDQHCLVLE